MMELNRMKVAALYAGKRAFEVWWAGVLAVIFWIGMVTLGPVLQARVFPVVSNFRIVEMARPEPGKIAFRPAFTKELDCRYLGMTWFVKDKEGVAKRVPVTVEKDVGAPETGPLGRRLGSMWTVPLTGEDVEMFGLLHHSCGFPWEARSIVGPFKLEKLARGFQILDRVP